MALIDMGRTSGHTFSFVDSIRNSLHRASVAYADWNDARRTRDMLSQLSAHELEDIGLSRGDIDAMSRAGRF